MNGDNRPPRENFKKEYWCDRTDCFWNGYAYNGGICCSPIGPTNWKKRFPDQDCFSPKSYPKPREYRQTCIEEWCE